ncbi:UNVERIFIED_CONTAM: hypothetical protein FKN15_027199 [Acipenser sinensis]
MSDVVLERSPRAVCREVAELDTASSSKVVEHGGDLQTPLADGPESGPAAVLTCLEEKRESSLTAELPVPDSAEGMQQFVAVERIGEELKQVGVMAVNMSLKVMAVNMSLKVMAVSVSLKVVAVNMSLKVMAVSTSLKVVAVNMSLKVVAVNMSLKVVAVSTVTEGDGSEHVTEGDGSEHVTEGDGSGGGSEHRH